MTNGQTRKAADNSRFALCEVLGGSTRLTGLHSEFPQNAKRPNVIGKLKKTHKT